MDTGAWRKYHVLEALLKDNEIIGKGKELNAELKDILSKIDRINAKDRKRLKELGIVSRENKHNKLYFHNDDRKMKKTGFYIIKDKFFEDMPDPYLKGNKAGNRPHYYYFEDTSTGIYWMIVGRARF